MSVAYVRLRCGVASRSDLSHDTADGMLARQRWTVLMREFMTWKNEPPPRPA
jgi:hypothetical protein